MLHATRRHLLSQPHRNGHRIEAYRTSDLETWDTVPRYELVDLTLGDTQQLCDISDDEGTPSLRSSLESCSDEPAEESSSKDLASRVDMGTSRSDSLAHGPHSSAVSGRGKDSPILLYAYRTMEVETFTSLPCPGLGGYMTGRCDVLLPVQ